MSSYAPTAIDLSMVPVPSVLEVLSFEELRSAFVDRFVAYWDEAREQDPTLPTFDVSETATDPVMTVARTFSYIRLLDRSRVNDAIKALLATEAVDSNLDNLVASRNLARLVVRAATPDSDVLMETDAQLLRRYLLSFDAPASGSAGRYLFDAWSAWPDMGDARVNGQLVHGRRGDADVVICGPNGVLPTEEQTALVASAVRHVNRMPEACSIAVLNATQAHFDVDLLITVPSIGPDPEVVVAEASERVRNAALARALVSGEIPAGFYPVLPMAEM